MTALDFGSLSDGLRQSNAAENLMRSVDDDYREFVAAVPEGGNPLRLEANAGYTVDLMRSVGPVSDAFLLSTDPAAVLNGPGGSAKTTTSIKKGIVEAQRIWPGPDGVRRYVLGVWRQKYVNLWKATIPSWWTILPKDLPGSKWVGAPPRDAAHVVRFEDAFGPVEWVTLFRAFGEMADPNDLKGNQYTDVYLNEIDTLPEDLFQGLADRVGRDPPQAIIRRTGRFWGDCNAPDVQNWVYRDWFETPRPGHILYRQPGGRDPGAENITPNGGMTREYYENSARLNAHRPWWVRVMVDNRPGFLRASNPVYPKWDDTRNLARATIPVLAGMPVTVGIDGGNTPAAAYMQWRGDGQLRILAEIALERGGMKELAIAMLQLEAIRFRDCTFNTRCDPSMTAREDTDDRGNVVDLGDGAIAEGSDRQRLAKYLGRDVKPARTQEVSRRIAAINDSFDLQLDGGEPGLMLDPACKGLRRGFNQTFHFRKISGTDDVGAIAKTFDGHVHEAAQYGGLESGSAEARRLVAVTKRRREDQRKKTREAARYNPLSRRR